MATTYTITLTPNTSQVQLDFNNGYTRYFNACNFEIEVQKINTNMVYMGDSQFNETLSYLNCTAPNPAGLTVYQWIEQVLLIVGECGGGGGAGVVVSIVAGDNIIVDSTDPANPIVSLVEYNMRSAADPVFLGANDSETIQNTVDAVSLLGRGVAVVPFRDVGWTITTPITVPEFVHLKGERNTEFIYADNITPVVLQDNTEVSEIWFFPSIFPTVPAINATGDDEVSIHNCRFDRVGILTTGRDCKIKNNQFYVSELPAINCSGPRAEITNNKINSLGTLNAGIFDSARFSDWTDNTAYNPGDTVITSAGNIYYCSVGGTSAVGIGNFPTSKVDPVVDGTVNWTYMQTSGATMQGGVVLGGQSAVDLNDNTFDGWYVSIFSYASNASFEGNYFESCGYCHQLNSANASASPPFNISYLNNKHFYCGVGFQFYLNNVATCTARNISVIGNQFNSNVGNLPFLDAKAIEFFVDTAGNSISNVTINENQIDLMTTQSSISISVQMENTATVAVILVQNNTVIGSSTVAIGITDGAALGTQRVACTGNQVFLGGGLDPGNIAAIANQIIYNDNLTA